MNQTDARTGGAWRPWLMWGLGAALYCYAFFQRVVPSVMVADLMRDFAIGAALVGNLSAFYFYSYAAVQVPVGVLVDRFGPRVVLAAGAGLAGAGSFLMGAADALELAYAGRLLVGAGVGVSFVASLRLASIWFPPHRFALLSGLTLMAGMAGGIGGQGPLAPVVVAFGWRGTLVVAGGVALALAALIWLFVRDKPADGSPRHHEHPHDSILGGLQAALGEPRTWVLSAIGMMQAAPLLAFAGLWAVPYAMTVYGLDRAAAAGMASLVLLGWAVAGPFQGWLSDRLGRRRLPIVVAGGFSLATMLAIVYWPGLPLWLAQILFVANGFACAAMPVVFAATREANPRAVGPALAFVNMCTVASGALFQPLIGWLLDRAWDGTIAAGARVYAPEAYRSAFIVLIVAALAGFALSFFVRDRRPGA